ncbi:hypothetical protein D1AOALGA4SA_4904, partial [Olavius algarvensis Delta 1 endosymbiont]
MEDTRKQIVDLIAQAEEAIPPEQMADLPPGPYLSGAPEWHAYEHTVWQCGESIRQLLAKKSSLRRDLDLQDSFLRIVCNVKAKRGRQSFVMLLGYTSCAHLAPELVGQLSDPFVTGHVIDTLLKMRCADYVTQVQPFAGHNTAWVRKKAITYVDRYRDGYRDREESHNSPLPHHAAYGSELRGSADQASST